MSAVVADTHTAIWYLTQDPSLSRAALLALDRAAAIALGSIPRKEIPDMPDRIIAATALVLNLPLVTCDAWIRQSHIETIW